VRSDPSHRVEKQISYKQVCKRDLNRFSLTEIQLIQNCYPGQTIVSVKYQLHKKLLVLFPGITN